MPANDTDNDDVQSMDQLVHDFNTALDETAGSNSSSRSSASRRKVRHVWSFRRILKTFLCVFCLKLSFSVLEAAVQEHEQPEHGAQHQRRQQLQRGQRRAAVQRPRHQQPPVQVGGAGDCDEGVI